MVFVTGVYTVFFEDHNQTENNHYCSGSNVIGSMFTLLVHDENIVTLMTQPHRILSPYNPY